MANTTHFEVDESLKPARDLMDTLRALQAAWNRFTVERQVLVAEKDTAAAGDAVFAKQATLLGYAAGGTNDTAQSAAADSFAEIDSCFNGCNAALVQMLGKHLTGG